MFGIGSPLTDLPADKTPETVVAAWSTVGAWHGGAPAPNGSVEGVQERYLHTYEVYSADYYGSGAKLFLRIKSWLQYDIGRVCTSYLGSTNDGNEEAIRKVMRNFGVH